MWTGDVGRGRGVSWRFRAAGGHLAEILQAAEGLADQLCRNIESHLLPVGHAARPPAGFCFCRLHLASVRVGGVPCLLSQPSNAPSSSSTSVNVVNIGFRRLDDNKSVVHFPLVMPWRVRKSASKAENGRIRPASIAWSDSPMAATFC